MTEKELERKLVDKVKKLGGRAFKFVSPGNSGVPDRLVVLPGNKIAFAELKSPENKSARLSKLQECQIRFLKSLDCAVNVIRSEAQLDEFIKKLQEG